MTTTGNPRGDRDPGYLLAMDNMDAASPEAKIVGDLLDTFFSDCRRRLNEIKSDTVPLDQLSKEIRKLIAFRFGLATAKTVTGTKRSSNAWNQFQSRNFKSAKFELGTYSLLLTIFTPNELILTRQVARLLRRR
jgi:hypothetical protein